MHACVCMCEYVCMHACVSMYMCVCVCMHACVGMYMCVCMYVLYMHVCACMCMNIQYACTVFPQI